MFQFNMFSGPFLVLPAVYSIMRASRDHEADLRALVFCLIVPSTVLLLSARFLGTVTNAWEASLHASSLPEGFLNFRLGRVVFTFLRTEVGFILAVLICASTAVVVSPVNLLCRGGAGVCLVSNVFLLMITGSFGSAFACLCGVAAIFFTQFRAISVVRVLVSVSALLGVLLLTYNLAPTSTKQYLEKRYEHRVTNANDDRVGLWARAVDELVSHPEGIGFTMSVGDKVKSFIHNDYLTYSVSYGLFGGLGYVILVVGLLCAFVLVRKTEVIDPSAFAVHLAGLGTIVAIALNSITDHMNANRWYLNAMWSIVWYCYFCGYATRRNAGVERAENVRSLREASPECVGTG